MAYRFEQIRFLLRILFKIPTHWIGSQATGLVLVVLMVSIGFPGSVFSSEPSQYSPPSPPIPETPELVAPISIENPTPGRPNHSEPHFVLEADQSRGTLQLKFEHELFGKPSQSIAYGVLALKVPHTPYGNTKSVISVWQGNQVLASIRGAQRGSTLRFNFDPVHFGAQSALNLTVKCGKDAVKISEDLGGVLLEVHYGTPAGAVPE